jgi:primary-amine oxidase
MAQSNSIRILPAASLIFFLLFILLTVNGINKASHSRIRAEEKRKWSILQSMKAQHPLDPLTPSELWAVQGVLRNASSLLGRERQVLHSVELEDPEKEEVLRWKPGQALPARRAEVIVSVDGVARKVVIDVGSGKIEDNREISGTGYPPMSADDFAKTIAFPATYQPFLDSLAVRGLKIDEVICLPMSPGWFAVPEEENKRLTKLGCFVTKDTPNFYVRPLEGVVIVVDLSTMQATRYIDPTASKAPIPKRDGTDYRFSEQTPPFFPALNPISYFQPRGPSFTLDGHIVKWANWEFHVRPNLRVGTVISQAKVDGRSVLYQGFLSELFVPYQSPEEGWYFRTYLDAGEYGLGVFSLPLQPLNDCPRHARYVDAVFAGPDGTPYVTPNMICIFERYAGDIAWQHAEVLAKDKVCHSQIDCSQVRLIEILQNF